MGPEKQFFRCRELWLSAIRKTHEQICSEGLDQGPWIEALLTASADFAALRADRLFLADVLLITARGMRRGETVPELDLMPAGTPHKSEAGRLFLHALRTAEHQTKLRRLDPDQVWIGFKMALSGYTIARLPPSDATRLFADLAEATPHVAQEIQNEGSSPTRAD